VVYHTISDCRQISKRWRGTLKKEVDVMPVFTIHSVIRIWSSQKSVYILKKHPGMSGTEY
jgi:hypothetical protein